MAVLTINDGDVIGLGINGLTLSNLNIEAATCGTGIGSVKFELDSNPNYRTENMAPYALCRNASGNYSGCTNTELGLGPHVVTATLHSGGGGTGTVLSRKTVQFTMAQIVPNAPAPSPSLQTPVPLPSPVVLQAPILLRAPTEAPVPTPVILPPGSPVNGVLKGELRKWHKITLTFQNGPLTSEYANLNPFTD